MRGAAVRCRVVWSRWQHVSRGAHGHAPVISLLCLALPCLPLHSISNHFYITLSYYYKHIGRPLSHHWNRIHASTNNLQYPTLHSNATGCSILGWYPNSPRGGKGGRKDRPKGPPVCVQRYNRNSLLENPPLLTRTLSIPESRNWNPSIDWIKNRPRAEAQGRADRGCQRHRDAQGSEAVRVCRL